MQSSTKKTLAVNVTRENGFAGFWDLVDTSAGGDGCWRFGRTSVGYGLCGPKGGERIGAHRVARYLACGDWPAVVMHACDTPWCVNPAHLAAGDTLLNSQDKVAKGRHVYGERSPHARLTEADVRAIREAVSGGDTLTRTGNTYGVSRVHVRRIVDGKNWGHVA